MEENLEYILKEYIKDVEYVCNNLINGINSAEGLNLKNKKDFFEYRACNRKMEFEVNGFTYKLHGMGCMAFNEEMTIDWDFGYRSRWCGIEPWKISMTLKKNGSKHIEYYDGNLIKEECEKYVEKGKMFKKYDQYYFEIPKEKTFKPEFPTEYDTLVIEHCNSKWSIPRNKVIDRFIRKSTWIYTQISDDDDKYILKFLLNGQEIYSVPYNDTGYPESAVKIMSDEILRKLIYES